jgi:hypothetical protein
MDCTARQQSPGISSYQFKNNLIGVEIGWCETSHGKWTESKISHLEVITGFALTGRRYLSFLYTHIIN